MSYEMQQYTLCQGWTNTWRCEGADGDSVPETFPTRAAAQAALDEFLAEIAEEIACGLREPEDGFCPDEFRIAEVAA